MKKDQYYIILFNASSWEQNVYVQPNFREAMKNYEFFKSMGYCPIVVKEVISCDGNAQ